MGFWDFIWFFFWGYILITFIGILIGLVFDVFRDPALNGWAKAAWVIFLIVFPLLASLVYIIARGGKMSERQQEFVQNQRRQSEDYIRSVASSSPSEEIAKARTLLDSGSITAAEYESLKARALGSTPAHAA